MTLGLKDIIYLMVYAVSIAGIFLAFKNELGNVRRDVNHGMKILYKDAGQLNLIDCETCKKHRDEIFTAIRRNEKSFEMFFLDIREIKEELIELRVEIKHLIESKYEKKD